MKRYFCLSLLMSWLVGAVSAQGLAPSPGTNFTRKETVYVSGKTTDAQVLDATLNEKSTVFEYADGLGRPIQTVSRQASPLQSDLVAPVVYDAKGRVSTGYLPYMAASNTGGFRTGAVSEQAAFYASPPTGVTGDTRPWSNTVYEDSPLDRVLQSTKVGADFASRFSSGKTLVNDASVVRKWDIVSNLPRSTSTYPAGTLTLVEGRDEDDHLVREYTDWLGRKVLSQVQASASTWFDTYYVYNDYNELLFVIPPSSAATLTPDLAHSNLWHFRYAYDDMGRQIGSKAPGAGWVLTVYDRWDRPVLTQDSVQRAKTPTKEWTYVKYDSHNRPCIVGTLATNSDRAALAPIVEAATGRFETRNTSSVGYTMNASYPTTATEASVLSITYYDDYNFKAGSGFSTTYDFQSVGDYGLSTYWGFNHLTEKLLGLVTGSKSRTQGENIAWMYSVTYYDKYYQHVQTVSSHQHGGKMRSSSLYAFSGEVLKSRTRYEYTGGGITTVERRFTYDHAGRPLKVYHRVEGNDEVLLSHYLYNELGEVTDIVHHSRNEGNTYLYKTTLKSSIQGWTDEITYRFSDNQTTIFQEKLDYQKSNGQGNAQKYSGLITSQRWKHYDTSPEQLYNYTYDIPKRLTGGLYRSKPSATWLNNELYNESNITYSANGNITALRRNRDNAGTAVQIDNLAYTYSGNRLTAATDNATTPQKTEGFNDGNTTATDYQYNGNGFLTSDANKGITAITYTAQNLPHQISFGSNTIKYTYDAGGTLMTQVYQGTGGFPNKTVHFVGELVFENGSLTDINHELGRVLANNSFKYQYYLTDHLGSTRVVLQEDPIVFTSDAGFEPIVAEQESEQFIGYDEVVRISADMLNHTPGAESSYVMRLSGGYGENVGLAKSISVMPGDTVRMEVFGKYIDIAEAKRNPAVMAVLMAITAADPIGMGIDGALSTSTNSLGAESGGLAGLLTSSKEMGDAPPAFLNYLFFDSEMNYKYGGFIQMSNEGSEDGSNVPHERLAQEVVAEEAGYFYIYLSNESNTGSEAFFDDFSIQVSESFIVQQIDYYPYGMIARNVARTTDKQTKDLFQGKTYEDLTKWYDFHARQYDASLGRWFGVDPQDQFASPYLAMGNNPVMGVDPDGELVFFIPQIGWSKNGGLNLGLEFGIGIPGVLSISATAGYNFRSSTAYWSVQGFAKGFYAGYGSSGGFAGWGYRYLGFSAGVGYGNDGLNVGVSFGATENNFNGALGFGWSKNGGFDVNTSGGYTNLIERPTVKKIAEYNLKNASDDATQQTGQFDCLISAVDYFDERSYDQIKERIGEFFNPESGTSTGQALDALYSDYVITPLGPLPRGVVSKFNKLNPISVGRQMELGNPTVVAKNKNHAIVPIKIELFSKSYRFRGPKSVFSMKYMDPAHGRFFNTPKSRSNNFPSFTIHRIWR